MTLDIYIYIYIYIYCGRKKTNKLPVHPYRSVSRLPTHQGIWVGNHETGLLGWTLNFICLFPPTIYTSLYYYVLSTVLRKSKLLFIHIFIYPKSIHKSENENSPDRDILHDDFCKLQYSFLLQWNFSQKKFNMQPGNALFLVKLTSYKLLRL